MMRRVFAVLVVATLASFPGCAWYDVWFDTLGDRYYSGGGSSTSDKRADYDDHLRSYGVDP